MEEYLKEHKVTKKDDMTHYGLGKHKGKYQIDDDDLEHFYDTILFDALAKGQEVSLIEKQQDVCKIVIDLDFKTKKDPERATIYTTDILTKFITLYNNTISEVLDYPINDNYISLILTRGDVKEIEGVFKNGVHIQYTGIACHWSKKLKIRNMVIENIKESGLFDEMNLSNSVEDVIDKAVIKSNGWLLYGCCKPGLPPYSVTGMYQDESINMNIGEIDKPIIYKLSQRHNEIESDMFINDESESMGVIKSLKQIDTPTSTNPSIIKGLLECYSPRRVDDYEDWVKTGMSLKTSKLENGFDLFNTFSQGSAKYNEDEVLMKWDSFDDNGKLTIASVYYTAQQDNPEKYKELIKHELTMDSFKHQMDVAFTDADMGELFIDIYKDNFIISGGRLYAWNGFLWEQDDIKTCPLIQKVLTGVFFNKCKVVFETGLQFIIDEMSKIDAEDDDSMAVIKLKAKAHKEAYIAVSRYLKCESGARGIVKYVIRYLVDDTIKFDEQPYIFCFTNQYIDISKEPGSDGYLLEASKELYISETCGYEYDNYSITKDEYELLKTDDKKDIEYDEDFMFIYNLIKQIFPHTDVRNLALKILSTGLSGITLEHFILFTGGGGNGKGVTDEAILKMVGSYGYDANVNMLIKPIPENGSPALANMDNKRFVVSNEPNEKEKLNVSAIKKITGGSSLNARALFSNICSTRLKPTIIMECNVKPKLDGEVNNAIERRLIEIPFISEFVEKQADVNEEEHKYLGSIYVKSNEFQEKYKRVWFALLSHYYNEYHNKDKQKIIVSADIKAITMEFINSSNDMNSYFEDLVKTDDKDDILGVKTDLYCHFKQSEYYDKFDKKQTKKWFLNEVKISNLTKKHYKDRHKVSGVDHRSVLVGYKLPEDEIKEEKVDSYKVDSSKSYLF